MTLLPAEVIVDVAVLADHPLPDHGAETSKHDRGTVVVVGGSRETPGATLLAATTALRAGAGKLQLVVTEPVSAALGIALPEARVIGVHYERDDVTPSTFDECSEVFDAADAVLVGTGALGADAGCALMRAVVPRLGAGTALVVDAGALAMLEARPDAVAPVAARTVAMPNAVEAARLLGVEPDSVLDDIGAALDDLVDRIGVCVTVRHAMTWTAAPGTPRFVDHSGHPALATSGSGDVLAGLLTGLAARGAAPLTAALWAVHTHAHAGVQAAQRIGGNGILARDLPGLVPSVLAGLGR
jgi:ADP-dependent NAD(P)H-hydrate dehydratase